MAKIQKIILLVWCCLIVLICLFMPVEHQGYQGWSAGGEWIEYVFILTTPSLTGVSFIRVIIEFVGATALCGAMFLLTDIFKRK